ncbi:transcriptional regulator [Nocardiopsis tropica]|uniref:Transcriptional regulator n=1 Tax=Nocardiopsis tropica TaxID=109330 RepID=A0ABV1ZX66_9ACTN|nr:transcriptional regulator [Nocardiopsis tropica]
MSAGGPSSATSGPATLVAVLALCVVLLTGAACPDAHQVPAEGADDGMSVLRRAAVAGKETAYSAVREVTGAEGEAPSHVHVVHRPGAGLALAPVGEEEAAFVVRASSALESLDERLLHMLEDTYEVTDAGTADLEGREARVVEAGRADGTVAGRFWVDTGTGLLVGSTVYEVSGEPALSVRLTGLAPGEGDWPEGAVGGTPWGDALTGEERDGLREDGWTLPEHLHWNLRLVDARSTEHAGRRVVHAIYSDGLSQVSVFIQRGKLDTKHTASLRDGYAGTDMGGSGVTTQHDTVFGGDVGQYQSMWQAGGFVYTVLADAPAGIASSAVTALPGPESSGFWARVHRGMSRLGFL